MWSSSLCLTFLSSLETARPELRPFKYTMCYHAKVKGEHWEKSEDEEKTASERRAQMYSICIFSKPVLMQPLSVSANVQKTGQFEGTSGKTPPIVQWSCIKLSLACRSLPGNESFSHRTFVSHSLITLNDKHYLIYSSSHQTKPKNTHNASASGHTQHPLLPPSEYVSVPYPSWSPLFHVPSYFPLVPVLSRRP